MSLVGVDSVNPGQQEGWIQLRLGQGSYIAISLSGQSSDAIYGTDGVMGNGSYTATPATPQILDSFRLDDGLKLGVEMPTMTQVIDDWKRKSTLPLVVSERLNLETLFSSPLDRQKLNTQKKIIEESSPERMISIAAMALSTNGLASNLENIDLIIAKLNDEESLKSMAETSIDLYRNGKIMANEIDHIYSHIISHMVDRLPDAHALDLVALHLKSYPEITDHMPQTVLQLAQSLSSPKNNSITRGVKSDVLVYTILPRPAQVGNFEMLWHLMMDTKTATSLLTPTDDILDIIETWGLPPEKLEALRAVAYPHLQESPEAFQNRRKQVLDTFIEKQHPPLLKTMCSKIWQR